MDMNQVFQEFVTSALRERLELSEHRFRSDDRLSGEYRVHLDEANRVGLKPDLSWWDARVCTFVGDAKYKRTKDARAPNADLYQMLAYVTALDLPGGLLVYAEGDGEGGAALHRVRHAGKHFRVATLDLAGPITRLDGEIRALAVEVRDLRQTTLDQRRGAWRRLVAGGRTGGIKVGDAGGRRHADAPSRSTKLRAVFAPIRNPYGWSVARSRARSPPRMLVML